MTDKPQEDVITKAEITCKDARYVRDIETQLLSLETANRALQAQLVTLQATNEGLERSLQFPECDSSLFVPRTWHEGMLANVRAQLPAEMQDCTIRFKECARGHGYLQPDNWVVPPCRQCTIDDLGARVNDLTEKLNLARAHCDILTENAQQHERRMAQALYDRLVARDELNSVRQAYSALLRQHERLRKSFGITNNINPEEPIAADEHGPIYKDDLCPEALRDGYLRRSAASKARRTAQPPKQEGDYGIELIVNGASECDRPNCPTKHPHRHLVHPVTTDELAARNLDSLVAQRRKHIQAMLDDEKSQIGDPDVIPTKENPNHVKEGSPLTEYPPGRLHQEFPGDQVKEPTAFQDFVDGLPADDESPSVIGRVHHPVPDETLDHSKPKITKTVNDYARERFMAHQKWADGSGEAGPHLTPRRPDEQDDLTEFPGEKVSDIGFRADEPVVTTMENGMIVHSHSSFPGGRAAHSPEIPCHECAKIGETQKFAEASSPVLDTNDPAVQQRFKEAFEQATGLEGHILSANSEEIKISGEYPPFSDETENTPDKKTEER